MRQLSAQANPATVAPGAKVHASGVPWDDRSGKRLRSWIGIDAQTFYAAPCVAIVPMGLCYPGRAASGNLPPRRECAPLWQSRLRASPLPAHRTARRRSFPAASVAAQCRLVHGQRLVRRPSCCRCCEVPFIGWWAIDMAQGDEPADSAAPGSVLTEGHSTRPIEQFIDLLTRHRVSALVDVRTMPRSRHNPQFNAEAPPASLAAANIAYAHANGLGGFRRTVADSPSTGWRDLSFRESEVPGIASEPSRPM